jgi:hypothetical protein
MRILVAVAVATVVGVAFGQAPMVRSQHGGATVIEVVCVDAMRRLGASEQLALERQFRSSIVIRCRAVATAGSGRVVAADFSYRHRYAADDRVHALRMSDFRGGLGEVYGNIELDFYIGLPSRQRPWVIVLHYGSGSTEIVFSTNP